MAGSKAGGAKAAATNKEKYGPDFYRNIGKLGGHNGRTGGFASEKIGKDGLTGHERAVHAGRKGGLNSSRASVTNMSKSLKEELKRQREEERRSFQEGFHEPKGWDKVKKFVGSI